jgi:hypothetical protein
VVHDDGKITQRHNAFFAGTDGSQFPVAYISPQPVRFIIEYDDVDAGYTSVSLVLVQQRIQGVPVTPVDPSTQAGTVPERVGARSSAPDGSLATTAGSTDGIDKATQAVNVVNDQKKKAQGFWRTVQSTVQPHSSHTAMKRRRGRGSGLRFFLRTYWAAWRIPAAPLHI